MATAKTNFTQEQIDNLSGVAKKYGGFENQNFQNAVNTKYGAWSYDSLNTSLRAIQTKQNAPVIPPAQVAPVSTPLVTPVPAPTPVPQPMQDFSKWQQVNQAWEEINAPTPERVAEFNKQFTTTPAPTPTQVEKTTTTTPEGTTTVKKETPGISLEETKKIAEASANNAQVETITGLNNTWSTSPELFSNQDTFRSSQGYDTASPEKKKILDAFFQAKNTQQNNPEALFQQMLSWVPVYNPETKSTPQYQQAKQRFDNLQNYSSYTTDQFASALVNGDILPGTQGYNDLLNNPEVKVKLEKAKILNDANGKKIDVQKATDNKSQEILDGTNINVNGQTMTIAKAYEDGVITADEMKQMFSNPKIDADTKVVNDKQLELDSLQNNYDNVRKQVEDELKWKDVTIGQREALIASRQRDLLWPLNLAIAQQNHRIGAITQAKSDQKDLINLNMDFYKDEIANKRQIAQEDRSFERQKELAKYQQDLQLQGNQAEFEQQMKQKAQIANDPYTAISTVMDQYQKLGIPFTQSIATKVADAQKFIAGGGTIGQYVDKMIGDIQEKPEYKAIQLKNAWWVDIKEITDANGNKISVKVDAQGNITPINIGGTSIYTGMDTDLRNSSYVTQYPNEASFKNNNPAGITWNANFDKWIGIAKALQDAGITYSKGTARPSAEGGNYVQFDTIGDGMKARQIVFSSTYGNKDLNSALQSWKWAGTAQEKQQYADSIMKEAGINPNQSISYNSLSQEQKDALTLSQIKRESGGLYKVLTQVPQNQWVKEYSDTQKNVMQGMDAKNISAQDAKILQQNKLSASDVYNYKASQKANKWSQWLDDTEYKRVNSVIDDLAGDQTTKSFKKVQEAYNFASKLQGGNTATDNQALIYAFAKAMDPDSVVREGEYATVQKYSQTWWDQLGMNINRILNGQEFISNTAKKNMVSTIGSKYSASKDAYNNIRKTKIQMINDIAGKDIGEKAIPSDVMEIQSSSEAPKKDYFSDTEANSLDYNKYF